MRLDKYLAAAGSASRRKAKALIADGRVAVNGVTVLEPGARVNEKTDRVAVDNRPIDSMPPPVCLMLHKPRGYLTTARDPQGRLTVYDLLTDLKERVAYAGRLDMDASGLLIMTNDGELTFRLTHPRFGVQKIYEAETAAQASDAQLRRLTEGVLLEDGPAKADSAEWIQRRRGKSVFRLALHDGRKRQVKRMCRAVKMPVKRLARVAYGPLRLGGLPVGKYRRLTGDEERRLRECVQLT